MDSFLRRSVQMAASRVSGTVPPPSRDTIIRDALLSELGVLCAELQTLAGSSAATEATDDAASGGVLAAEEVGNRQTIWQCCFLLFCFVAQSGKCVC